MPPTNSYTGTPRDVFALLRKYPFRWLLPALLITALAAVYAKMRPAVWEASQALMVRDEAGGGDHLGRFHVAEDMKTVQETILELAKSHSVVSTALTTVGPPADRKTQAPWPTDQEIAGLVGSMKLSPPKGAEFGKTEVFYLQVQSTDRERAIALASALCDQLKKRFEDLRDAKAQSLVEELGKTVTLAQNDLQSATVKLTDMDAKTGSDLGELRTLLDAPSGDSPLRHSVTEMETELRVASVAMESNQSLLKLLQAAKDDPNALAAAPSRLLESQPSLKRLKDGLVDAQLRTSQLLGSMSETHPSVIAAKAAEGAINDQIHDEVDSATRGVELELSLATSHASDLKSHIADARERLDHLAEIRAEYSNVVSEVHFRSDTLKSAETQLAEARASLAAAHTASLLSRIDTPDTGATPIGPSRTMIVAGGAAGGLILGLGLLFLTVPPLIPRTSATVVAETHAEVVHVVENGAITGGVAAANGASENGAFNGNGAKAANGSTGENGSSGLPFKQALAKLQAGALSPQR